MGTYVITGATRGIGRAVAHRLAAHRLVVAGRNRERLRALCAALPDAAPLLVDLAEPTTIESACVAAAVPGRIDGLVHCAGTLQTGGVEDVAPDEWRRSFDINVVAAAELTRVLLPALRARRGTVVLVNSGSGERVARGGTVAYAASKFALRALADSLRLEEPAVRVGSVFPGRVDTDMQHELQAYEGATYDARQFLRPESVARVIVGTLLAPVDADVQEVRIRPTGRR